MIPVRRSVIPLAVVFAAVSMACQPTGDAGSADPHLTGGTDIERGRYLVVIGGCNDCHTPGFLETEGNVPEEQWLLGSSLGFRGPWGTTYPPNLRLTAQSVTEDGFVDLLHTRTALPPMPWVNVNQMAESDARVLYRYLRSLSPVGEPVPAPVPPDQEPTTPYISLAPIVPEP